MFYDYPVFFEKNRVFPVCLSMILMTDTKYFTVSRAMLNFSSAHTQEIGSQFAYVVMSVIPMLIIYIVFHKQIEKGMLSGAIKG